MPPAEEETVPVIPPLDYDSSVKIAIAFCKARGLPLPKEFEEQ